MASYKWYHLGEIQIFCVEHEALTSVFYLYGTYVPIPYAFKGDVKDPLPF